MRKCVRGLLPAVVLLAVSLTGCGEEPSASEADAPAASESPPEYAAPVAFDGAAGGSGPSSERIEEVVAALESADTSGGTADLEECPLGTPEAVLSGVPSGWLDRELSATADSYGSLEGADVSGTCSTANARVFIEPMPEGLSETEVITGLSPSDDEGVTQPVDFFSGRAFTYCYTNVNRDAPACGAAWFNDRITVRGTLFSPGDDGENATAEAAAAWLSRALPATLGDEEVAATVNPFDIEGALSLSDAEGYTLDAEYSFTATEFTADPIDSPPGFTELVQTTNGTVSITNTTPERNLDMGLNGVLAKPVALYEEQGPVCQMLSEIQGGGYVSGGGFCFLLLGEAVNWQYAEEPVLEVGESQTRTTDDPPVDGVSETRIADVPEEQAEALAAALDEPAGMALFGGSPDATFPPKFGGADSCVLSLTQSGSELEWLVYPNEKTPDALC